MSRSPCAGRHWAKLTWKRAGWGARSLSSSPPRSSMETLPRTAKGQQQQRSSTSPSWPLPFSTMQRARGCVQRESERSSVPLVQQARGEEGGREERGGVSARTRVRRKETRPSESSASERKKKKVRQQLRSLNEHSLIFSFFPLSLSLSLRRELGKFRIPCTSPPTLDASRLGLSSLRVRRCLYAPGSRRGERARELQESFKREREKNTKPEI